MLAGRRYAMAQCQFIDLPRPASLAIFTPRHYAYAGQPRCRRFILYGDAEHFFLRFSLPFDSLLIAAITRHAMSIAMLGHTLRRELPARYLIIGAPGALRFFFETGDYVAA